MYACRAFLQLNALPVLVATKAVAWGRQADDPVPLP